MDYRVEIEDMQNLGDPLIVHYASRDAISHSWLGGDDKTKPIVPCEFAFDLEVSDGADAKYIDYFTEDEKRWRVTEYLNDTNEIIYRGFLLPETYEEPYENPLFYVKFQAVDGLGLLKGKKLPDSYYKDFKSPIQIICACLKLTNIDFDVYFSPAIENSVVPDWNKIWHDTRPYFEQDEDELPSAFEFLEGLVKSMQCQLFQCEGRWYVEGINKRQIKNVNFAVYSINGNFKGNQEVEKNIKDLTFFYGDGVVSMVPALGEVSVYSEIGQLGFSEDHYQYTDINWIVQNGVDANVIPEKWLFANGYKPIMRKPNYYLKLPASNQEELNLNQWIRLREKPFVFKGTGVKFTAEFQFVGDFPESLLLDPYSIEDAFDDGKFENCLIYQILIDSQIIYSNAPSENTGDLINLDQSGKGELNLEFIVPEDGYLDLKFFAPVGDFSAIENPGIEVRKITIEEVAGRESDKVVIAINEKSTKKLPIELPVSTDNSMKTKCFSLDDLRKIGNETIAEVEIPILYGFRQNEKSYSAVSLEGAKLIEAYGDSLFWKNYFLTIPNPVVHYNFNKGEEFVVETPSNTPYVSDSFYVSIKPFATPEHNREDYFKWTESIYKTDSKPYNQVVAELYEKLYAKPHIKVLGSTGVPIKFNDILRFYYKNKNYYLVPTDVNRMPDAGIVSSIIAEEAFFKGSLNTTPPLVDAGPDLYIKSSETTAQITEAIVQAAYGEIREILWEQIEGLSNSDIVNPDIIHPEITNITTGENKFKLTATDSFGNSASDTMSIFKIIEFNLYYDSVIFDNSQNLRLQKVFTAYVNPGIPENEQVVFNYTAFIDLNASGRDQAPGEIVLKKNGSVIFTLDGRVIGVPIEDNNTVQKSGVISVRSSDIVQIQFYSAYTPRAEADPYEADQYITFTDAGFQINKTNQIGNLPVKIHVTDE
ncbi:PKD domain-containing protein [Zunongwangia profunda]|uniref:PKD domain-containing protein n=1 Tax=Zunongwangia profunda TaxID=398743 RepID=UPI00248E60DC|nr:hypothetical protein [Zunongwangia profunda]|tara:strand:- start:2789 stop:5581 length:2793 start_codon:yes stop_codon:yes gene_type:complete